MIIDASRTSGDHMTERPVAVECSVRTRAQLIAALHDAHALLGAVLSIVLPSDNVLIVERIRDAYATIANAIANLDKESDEAL